jgi:hypothetical protein
LSEDDKDSWLHYVNLSDSYERKARFLPGVLSFLFLFPISGVLGSFFSSSLGLLTSGVGVGSIIAVGISHLASAAGNSIQRKYWPEWPHDSPTHRWLNPKDESISSQQRKIWYKAIQRLTGLDIEAVDAANEKELRAIINDAVRTLRYRLRNSEHADRLRMHNMDYGFARNFAGLRSLWLSLVAISFVVCLIDYSQFSGQLSWVVISSVVLILGCVLAFVLLPRYVHWKAESYAESFFGAMVELDRGERGENLL